MPPLTRIRVRLTFHLSPSFSSSPFFPECWSSETDPITSLPKGLLTALAILLMRSKRGRHPLRSKMIAVVGGNPNRFGSESTPLPRAADAE